MSGRTILITRGMGDGDELREALHERGHRVIHEPLTEIFLKHTARAELDRALSTDPDAIIATSRYGIRALASLNEYRDAAILCVGDASADVAHSAGYTRVYNSHGGVEELVAHIAGAYEEGSRFLYVSAEHVHADLEALLAEHGMEVTRIVLYEATASEQLSDTLIEQLKREQIDAATFMSARSAKIFMELLAKADAVETTAKLDAYCLSAGVATALKEGHWRAIFTAREPTLASLLESVDNDAHD